GQESNSASNVYAESFLPLLHFRWSPLRGLQVRGMKSIDAPQPELYDTKNDPQELHNLISSKPAISYALRDRLYTMVRQFTLGSGAASAEKEVMGPGQLERLRSLGYVAVPGGTLAEATTKGLPDPKDRIGVYEQIVAAGVAAEHGNYRESLLKLS